MTPLEAFLLGGILVSLFALFLLRAPAYTTTMKGKPKHVYPMVSSLQSRLESRLEKAIQQSDSALKQAESARQAAENLLAFATQD